jgi:hydroxycarboxylate dehydrogenase B
MMPGCSKRGEAMGSHTVMRGEALRGFIAAILAAAGSGEAEAREVAAHLVEANLKGHDSHGIGMIPTYVQNIRAGILQPNTHARLVQETGAIGVFDGGMGFGQVIAREAVDWAAAKARESGVGVLALRNTHHLGRIGTYGEQAAASGLVSIHFVNVLTNSARVAPFGGLAGRYGTDPICITFPGSERVAPVVLDFATSHMAAGKIRVALNEGKSLPPGVLIDASGAETTDPAAFLRARTASLLSFGGHKASGLALACQLLAGVLAGAGVMQADMPGDRGVRNGMLSILLDPGKFGDPQWCEREMAILVSWVKSSPPLPGTDEVLVAGEPERRAMAERLAAGVPIDAGTWAELLAAAALAGLSAEAIGSYGPRA